MIEVGPREEKPMKNGQGSRTLANVNVKGESKMTKPIIHFTRGGMIPYEYSDFKGDGKFALTFSIPDAEERRNMELLDEYMSNLVQSGYFKKNAKDPVRYSWRPFLEPGKEKKHRDENGKEIDRPDNVPVEYYEPTIKTKVPLDAEGQPKCKVVDTSGNRVDINTCGKSSYKQFSMRWNYIYFRALGKINGVSCCEVGAVRELVAVKKSDMDTNKDIYDFPTDDEEEEEEEEEQTFDESNQSMKRQRCD
jgi:hypothetical protein